MNIEKLELMVKKWQREAEASDKLAEQFKFDLELKTQYETDARRLRACAFDLGRNLSE